MPKRLRGKRALVTGASSGIGSATARALAAEEVHLVLAARRADRLEALATSLEGYGIERRTLALDVRDAEAVAVALGGLEPPWGELDILVNNAGLSRGLASLAEGDLEDWKEMVDTNVVGLLQVTRALLPGMLARGHGHVVNVGSIAGHEVYPGGNVYCSTKFAVRALTRAMRLDLAGSPVRVTSVDPGMVETEFSVVRFHGDRERADAVYRGMTPLTPEDVAEAIVWCLSRPDHVNVEQVILMPRDQASATLVHREG